MSTFAEFQEADRRLVLLKALASAAGYKANAYLLRKFAASLGHVVGGDRIAADLAWLRDSGLIGLAEELGVTVATITARGKDVADGVADVPGVAKPQPL